APHTAAQVVGDWTHPYSREVAVHPVPAVAADKYWPPVRRVDGAYGDRNLMCSCPPLSAFAPERAERRHVRAGRSPQTRPTCTAPGNNGHLRGVDIDIHQSTRAR